MAILHRIATETAGLIDTMKCSCHLHFNVLSTLLPLRQDLAVTRYTEVRRWN